MIGILQSLLFFLLILFLPTQFGKHFWPDFAYVLGQRIDYLSPTLYFSDILIVSFVVISFLKNRIKNYELRIKRRKTLIVAFLFLFLSIGSYLSVSPFAGWYYLLKLVEFILLGFALKESSQFHPKADQPLADIVHSSRFILPLSIGIIFESLLAIAQFQHQASLGGLLYYLGERTFDGTTPGIANASLNGTLVLRPYATFPHPNVLAAYLVIGMTILISNFKFQISKRSTLYLLALLLGTIALFLSLSRIAILLWLIILTFVIGHNLWNKIKHLVHPTYYLLFIPSIFLTMLILLFTFFPDLKYRILTLDIFNESITERIELMQAAQQMFVNNPVFGVGFGNFLPNLPLYLSSSHFVQLLQPVHNIFYLIAAETGIPGLLFFLWFLGKTFLRETVSPPNILISQYRNITLLVLVFILGMFDHYFLTLQQGQLLLTLVLSMCWVDDVANSS